MAFDVQDVYIWLDNDEKPLRFNDNLIENSGIIIEKKELDKLVSWLKKDESVFELKINYNETMILYKYKIRYAEIKIIRNASIVDPIEKIRGFKI